MNLEELSGDELAAQIADARAALLNTTAAKYNLDPDLVRAIQRQENPAGDPRARSPKGAMGLMQVMPATAAGYGVTPEQLVDPEVNVDVGVHIFADRLAARQGDVRLALADYNAGPGAVDKYGDVPPFPETQKYVTAILTGAHPKSGGAKTVEEGGLASMTDAELAAAIDAAAPQAAGVPGQPEVPAAPSGFALPTFLEGAAVSLPAMVAKRTGAGAVISGAAFAANEARKLAMDQGWDTGSMLQLLLPSTMRSDHVNRNVERIGKAAIYGALGEVGGRAVGAAVGKTLSALAPAAQSAIGLLPGSGGAFAKRAATMSREMTTKLRAGFKADETATAPLYTSVAQASRGAMVNIAEIRLRLGRMDRPPAILKELNELPDEVSYGTATAFLSDIGSAARKPPPGQDSGRQLGLIREAHADLSDAITRSLGSEVSPTIAATWTRAQALERGVHNQDAIIGAITKSSGADGVVSGQKLFTQLRSKEITGRFTDAELGDARQLAKALAVAQKKRPEQTVLGLMIGGSLGYHGAAQGEGVSGAMRGAAVGYVVPALVARALTNGPLAKLLVAAARTSPGTQRAAALMGRLAVFAAVDAQAPPPQAGPPTPGATPGPVPAPQYTPGR